MKTKLLFVALLFFLQVPAQNNVPAFIKSTLVITSEDKQGRAWKLSVDEAYMILNVSDGNFILNANLSTGSTGDKKLDTLLRAGGDLLLSFKGNINENLNLFNQQQNDERIYPMPGTLSLDASSVSCTAQFDPINLAEKSESKNYRMDFVLSVDAAKLPIRGLENEFSRQLALEIVAGKLNVQQ